MKKGQGIGMNTIIIAAIALLVLVIISVLVLNTGETVVEGQSCSALGGTCKEACDGSLEQHNPTGDQSCEEDTICCTSVDQNQDE